MLAAARRHSGGSTEAAGRSLVAAAGTIEAAAAGLAPVATENGGPSEIFADGSGILVDPFSERDIARGLLEGLNRYEEISKKAMLLVEETYTWKRTAKNYISVIEKSLQLEAADIKAPPETLNASSRNEAYLGSRSEIHHEKNQ